MRRNWGAFPALLRQAAIVAMQGREGYLWTVYSHLVSLFFSGLGIVLLAGALESNEGSAAA